MPSTNNDASGYVVVIKTGIVLFSVTAIASIITYYITESSVAGFSVLIGGSALLITSVIRNLFYAYQDKRNDEFERKVKPANQRIKADEK